MKLPHTPATNYRRAPFTTAHWFFVKDLRQPANLEESNVVVSFAPRFPCLSATKRAPSNANDRFAAVLFAVLSAITRGRFAPEKMR